MIVRTSDESFRLYETKIPGVLTLLSATARVNGDDETTAEPVTGTSRVRGRETTRIRVMMTTHNKAESAIAVTMEDNAIGHLFRPAANHLNVYCRKRLKSSRRRALFHRFS